MENCKRIYGAVIGDIVGSRYEFQDEKPEYDFPLFTPSCHFTDDSVMTVAVLDAIKNKKDISATLREWGSKYPDAGYGFRFREWLANPLAQPYCSYGNGAAMRISSVGYLASSIEETVALSDKVTEISHNHPEGMKGARVTSSLIYYALHGKDKDFLKEIALKDYPLSFSLDYLIKEYGFDESCQGTVPVAIYIFLISKSFEDCLRLSQVVGGDSDTLGAISCSIASAFYPEIPKELLSLSRLYLPKAMTEVLDSL